MEHSGGDAASPASEGLASDAAASCGSAVVPVRSAGLASATLASVAEESESTSALPSEAASPCPTAASLVTEADPSLLRFAPESDLRQSFPSLYNPSGHSRSEQP